MSKYITGGACSDCGTWSSTGAPITPSDCTFCKDWNSDDDAADNAA